MLRPALLLFLLLPAVGCSSLPSPLQAGQERDAEIAELQQRVLELQRQATVSEIERQRLEERVAELEGRRIVSRGAAPVRLPQAPPAAPRSPGSTSTPASPAAAPPTSTSTSAPDAAEPGESTPAAPPRRSSGIEGEDIDVESVAVEPGEPPPPPPDAPAVADSSAPPSGVPGSVLGPVPNAPASPEDVEPLPADEMVSAEARALYDQGFTHYHEGRYVEAETAFQRFLQEHPRTELADNASFWIGEARLQREDVRGALAAYRQTVLRYPSGNKIPDALLKAGECLETLGDGESARLSYQEVIERYPNTAAAEIARARIERLR